MTALRIKITRCGTRAICPFCKKEYAVPPSVHAMSTQGIWSHIKAKHNKEARTGMFDAFQGQVAHAVTARRKKQKAQEEAEKARLATLKKEEREAPKREHVLTGAFLIDVVSELQGALEMMEPYYSQCNADESGRAMIEKLESIIHCNGDTP